MKMLRYLGRELRASTTLALRLPLFLRRRQRVRNSITIYMIVSSVFVRVGARMFRRWIRSRFIPIVVKFRDGPSLRYPLTAYLNNSDDFFNSYFDYYFKCFEDHFGYPLKFEQGDFVIDIGAHIGTFCVPLAHAQPVHIVAVEPSRVNARYLRSNVEKNGLSDRVQVIQKAVSADLHQAEFMEGDASTRGTLNAAMVRHPGRPADHYVVEVVSLPEIMDMAPHPSRGSKIRLLKMDCEGAEYEILRAMPPERFAEISDMFLEVHARHDLDETAEDLINHVRSMGFDTRQQDVGNGNWEVFCHREINPTAN